MRLFAEKEMRASHRGFGALKSLLLTLLLLTGCRRGQSDDLPLPTFAEYERNWRARAILRPGPIFLDPGHGGRDFGAMSCRGLLEKRLNLETAFSLQTALAKRRLPTKLSRTRDHRVELDQRARLADEQRSLLLISLHHNWAQNSKAKGIEIFYPREEFGKERSQLSRALATAVLKQLSMRGFATSRGIKASGFRVLAHSSMPAILIEGGFLSNDAESRQLAIPARRKLLAVSIASGIEEFLKKTGAQPQIPHRTPTAANRVQRLQRSDGR